MTQLRRDEDKLRAAGAELVVIGSGAPSFALGFRETVDYHGLLLCDPELATYQAAGLERGLLRTMSVRSVGKMFGALKQGFKQGRTQGDQYQQGGVVVIRPPGRMIYRYVSQRSGDHPANEEVLAALVGKQPPETSGVTA